MEMALVKFVGSGMAVVSSGLGFTVPQSAIRNGYALVSYLTKQRGAETSALFQEITTDLWGSWSEGQVPREAALTQLQGLPIILANHCPPPNYFASGLKNAAAEFASGRAEMASGGRLIAAEVIMRARETNAFEKAGLNEQLCYFLMERLFVQLLSRFELFEEMKPELQSYILKKVWQGNQSANADPVSSLSGLSLDAPSDSDKNLADHQATFSSDVNAQVASRDEVESLTELSALEAAADQYDSRMKLAQDAETKTMQQLQLGRLRMRIGVQTGNDNVLQEAKALLDDGLARPLLMDKDGIRRKARIDLADLLWEQSKLQGDRELAVSAAATLEPVCQSLRATGQSGIWVKTHTLLATIYQGLSREQGGIEELQKAARHFEKAAERLPRTSQPLEWATLVNKLSYVLELIGVRARDLDVLAQAAEVKRAAIDVFEVHGDSATLEALRDELFSLHDEAQRLSHPEKLETFSKSA